MPTNAATGASCTINLIQPASSTASTSSSTNLNKIPCQEYKHQTTTDPATGAIQEIVTIESQPASPFEIVINIKPTTYSSLRRSPSHHTSGATRDLAPEGYCFRYLLDGIPIGRCKQHKLKRKFPHYARSIYSSDRSTLRSFQFDNVHLVDPDDYQEENRTDQICNDDKVIKSLGTIQIDVIRSTFTSHPRRSKNHSRVNVVTTNQMKFSERSEKACLSTTVGLAEESISDRSPSATHWRTVKRDPQPFLQFIFKYKPRSILESEGTITPSVTIETADTAVEIDSEKEDESKKNTKNGKNKNNKRIKNEDEDGKPVNNNKDKQPKIIDLTGSDNDS
ncbi:hypothetical protein Pst134EA_001044 [Puccinia striiformis f. sp. tritici]|uniref:hypothetical protein n=1 Tax=Puccinia striiformis f. sp. tritici TaxID=168172 RepID=UPI0020078BC4|nr:hypothetical protein Pst134EA_001044 [Puccinia striiformis f. sp. tritici]KAH9473989.1 hypothetical protein Pst134EA_001044 [Puccinia striiformis f. sp. tritici]KAI9626400.1 hypothetical protein H4Q26_017863 [Puccinia striiformis f. sp. tritici PST-130]